MRRIRRAGIGRGFRRRLGRWLRNFAPGLSKQGLELGEDLFDGVEVGGVFRQEHQAGSDIPDRLAHRLSFVGSEIVEDDDVARLQSRHEELIDIGAETLAVDGSVKQAGRVDAIVAQGGEERRGLRLALRNLVDEALSFGAQPRSLVMLVFVQVSSMKTRRRGSMRPW